MLERACRRWPERGHLRLGGIGLSAMTRWRSGHLQEPPTRPPDHAAVLIGRYRFYFYKGRLHEALGGARVLAEIRRATTV